MNEMVYDWTMWNYLLTIFVSAYGAGLFAWWAEKAGKPSAVFLYVMGIFMAEGWAIGIAMYGRWLHFYSGHTGYSEFMQDSVLWATRTLPTTIVLGTLAIHMSFRAFVKKRNRSVSDFASTGDKSATEKASEIVADAAVIAANVVKESGKVAARKVSDEAKTAADNVRVITNKTVADIKKIHLRRDTDG